MRYISTRDKNRCADAPTVIKTGISPDGGLFAPESIPALGDGELYELISLDYRGRALKILQKYLTGYDVDELRLYVEKAYGTRFSSYPDIAPVVRLCDGLYSLELWHGPTCAFKDMALQLLPHLLTGALKKTGETKTAVILTATSGDTGKAALEGFRDVEGTKIVVYYPSEGVSSIQKLQMISQQGNNVAVCGIEGNFDDAQNGVKAIFTDPAMIKALSDRGFFLSSANSINWGRLAPQIVYYISAYCDLVKCGQLRLGDKVNFVVPTGNFGNILAGYYAARMGLPVHKLICASNRNNVLTDFIQSGRYDRNRPFYATASPSMDILVSSNLERMLFDVLNRDDGALKGLMDALKTEGRYRIGAGALRRLRGQFDAGFADEDATMAAIRGVFTRYGYLCDTHTAVAFSVCDDYRQRTKDGTPAVVVSTASPYKFAKSVLSALSEAPVEGKDDFEIMDELSRVSRTRPPQALYGLKKSAPRFTHVCGRRQLGSFLLNFLG